MGIQHLSIIFVRIYIIATMIKNFTPHISCIFLAGLCSLLTACSDENNPDDGGFAPQPFNVTGKVEKGPFVSGSTITVQPMNADLQASGQMYASTIQDNAGNFSFGSKTFDTPYAELTANGYFFNEVEGSLSAGTLNLRALADLSDASTVNVNILTHLKYQRIANLMKEGQGFTEANRQSQGELMSAFGLQKYAETDASRFSITAGNDEAGALIAVSSLLIVDRSEAELTEYLARLCQEFGKDGKFSDETLEEMKSDKARLTEKLSSIRENIISRYEELGTTVEVKELARFFDWDNDGTAGNETLQDGESISLETTHLDVPNEGGIYHIGIDSPIPLYTTPPLDLDSKPNDQLSPETFWTNLYEDYPDADISLTQKIDGNTLTIEVARLDSRYEKTATVTLYDARGNEAGQVSITQKGNGDTSVPLLGKDGQTAISGIAMNIAKGFSMLNRIEQYYHFNPTDGNLVSQYITPASTDVEDGWSHFYYAINQALLFKEAEAKQLNVYGDLFNTFNALCYYNMVVMWGDLPYRTQSASSDNLYIGQTAADEILNRLKQDLTAALASDALQEKRNESLGTANDFFFLSKDVARILLADIHLYQHHYAEAMELLQTVIDKGYYSLDASDYSNPDAVGNLAGSSEIIFALRNETVTRSSSVTVSTPPFIPLLNYTDVVLSYAESLYKNGDATAARHWLDQVVSAKGLATSSAADVLAEITHVRRQLMLYSVGQFAYLKRNGIAAQEYDVESFRTLLPIPQQEILTNPNVKQNPGYSL